MEAQKKDRNSTEKQLPKFKCDILGCEKVFNTKFVLKRHYQKHYQKQKYQCRTCNKYFNLLQYLEEHEHVHTGKKPYICRICGEGFRQRGKLSFHRRNAHNQHDDDHDVDQMNVQGPNIGQSEQSNQSNSAPNLNFITNSQIPTPISNLQHPLVMAPEQLQRQLPSSQHGYAHQNNLQFNPNHQNQLENRNFMSYASSQPQEPQKTMGNPQYSFNNMHVNLQSLNSMQKFNHYLQPPQQQSTETNNNLLSPEFGQNPTTQAQSFRRPPVFQPQPMRISPSDHESHNNYNSLTKLYKPVPENAVTNQFENMQAKNFPFQQRNQIHNNSEENFEQKPSSVRPPSEERQNPK